ncbi:MAG: Gfo/Idh/MocA family oxidoreductase [Clostridia bacterium]|nr:Gfo/Idh/MocA family oxidoreductase [Clostridia bacterium]
MDKFRWAYIGSGSIAATTARSILKGDHEITVVYSRNFEKAQAFAKKFGGKAVETLDELLSCDNIDAVYIATPHTSHVEYAVAALKKGIPVLCEKPVGVTQADVELLIKTAKENDTYFVEAMWSWFSDTAIAVRDWVKRGKIGRVKSVKIIHAYPGLNKKPGSRVLDPMTAGGALLDIGIYPITYCYNIFGYPDSIKCEGTIQNGIDIKEKVTLYYGNMPCELYMSFEKLKESFVAEGTDGKIKLPMFHIASFAVMKSKKGNKVAFGKTTYLNEFDRVAKEIREGKKESDYVPFEATLNCMKIMDACREQMGLKYPFEK